MAVWARRGGNWREAGPGEFHARLSGAWQNVETGYVRDGGTWKIVYQNSDPQTVQYACTDSNSFRNTLKWRGVGDVYQGSWDYGDHCGIIAFDASAIQANLAVRPAIKSARLRLRRQDGHGYGSAQSPTFWAVAASRISAGGSITASGDPSSDFTLKDKSSTAYGRNERIWADIPIDIIEAIRDDVARGIGTAISFPLQGTSLGGGGQDVEYLIFNGFGQSDPPILEITSDFI